MKRIIALALGTVMILVCTVFLTCAGAEPETARPSVNGRPDLSDPGHLGYADLSVLAYRVLCSV